MLLLDVVVENLLILCLSEIFFVFSIRQLGFFVIQYL